MNMQPQILEALDVSFSYGRQNVLEHISLQIRTGSITMLLGPNGCGKTTLLKLLAGRLTPSSGSILLNQNALRNCSDRKRALQIAVVPQSAVPAFGFSVREMVMMGRYANLSPLYPPARRDEEAVRDALQTVDLQELANRSCSELSGGERQRVSLAAAFAAQTPFLLLDEPFSALDPLHAGKMMSHFMNLRASCGLLLITHDIFLAANYADRVVFLKEGRVVADGIPSEVICPDILRDVYDCPFDLQTLANGLLCPVPLFRTK